ncbi:MAG: PAS domain-containing protein [Candidatus Methylumidiphilus sp.]
MPLIITKDSGIIPQVLTAILDHCVNGVTLADPDLDDCPIVYANKAFENLTGYKQEDIIGRNCRFLQGTDTDQLELDKLRESLKKHEAVKVNLRNYRKDGSLFHNLLEVTPLLDNKGNIIYYLGVQYDVSYKVNAENEINELHRRLKA